MASGKVPKEGTSPRARPRARRANRMVPRSAHCRNGPTVPRTLHPVTECYRPTCRMTAHVVLFAVGGEFDGRHYAPGDLVLLCLKHGGEAYDAIHDRFYTAWLDLPSAQLPTVKSPYERPPGRRYAPRAWTPPHRDVTPPHRDVTPPPAREPRAPKLRMPERPPMRAGGRTSADHKRGSARGGSW